MRGYGDDLAYIHDAAFSDYGRNTTPGLLRMLRRNGITDGLVVDLGCGSGRWAGDLNQRGYAVVGVDQSPAFIRLARKIAPQSKFVLASLLRVELPACDAVTSVGECLNYCFDRKTGNRELARLFVRVYRALRPGGVFIFDVAEPARVPEDGPRRTWFQGADWAVLVETAGDRSRKALTRRIICFRKTGRRYRRSEEIHRLRLYSADEVVEMLRRAGFRAECLRGYGRFRLPAGIVAFVAKK
ncbi:MAG TPA: methyltransferase domain-containing protein [Bryobacteraceae bacterium]|nr:methyltransferase domain-containing protein [Bryobacteraceae bacterium]